MSHILHNESVKGCIPLSNPFFSRSKLNIVFDVRADGRARFQKCGLASQVEWGLQVARVLHDGLWSLQAVVRSTQCLIEILSKITGWP